MEKVREAFAVIGSLVDCPPVHTDEWSLRIRKNSIIVVDKSGKILEISDASSLNDVKEKYSLETIIRTDESNEFLMPGMIDSHIHASQYPNAGLGLDLPLLDWLKKYTFPTERRFGEDLTFARSAYEQVVEDTLASGTTSASYYATIDVDASLILCDVAEEKGQRALVGKVNMDRNGFERYQESTSESLASTKNFVANVLQRNDSLVQPIVTPRFSPTCTKELLTGLGEIAKENGVRIQTHLSECCPEVAWVKELEPWAKNYTDVYKQTGILTKSSIMAHGVYLEDNELAMIKEAGAGISHCANSNNSIRSGSMDAVRYRDFGGLKIGIGTDNSGGYSPSMMDALRFSIATSNNVYLNKMLAKVTPLKPALDFRGALYLATRGSAIVCTLQDQVGGFDVGLEFDALRIRMDKSAKRSTHLFGFETLEDMVHKFVFIGDDRNIVQVFVQGRLVKNLI